MNKCDTSKLTTLVALFKPQQPGFHAKTMVELAWHAMHANAFNNVVDLNESHTFVSPTQMANDLGLPGLYLHQSFTTLGMLHESIAQHCPLVTSLKVFHSVNHGSQDGAWPGVLFQQPSIRQLHLLLIMKPISYRERLLLGPYEESPPIPSVSQVINMLPNLKVLRLSSLHAIYNDSVSCRSFFISSSTLQSLSVVHTGKHNWIKECICPKLRRIVCRGYGYGNGLRPVREDSSVFWSFPGTGQYLVRASRFDGTHYSNEETPFFEGLKHVPDSCLIVLKDEW